MDSTSFEDQQRDFEAKKVSFEVNDAGLKTSEVYRTADNLPFRFDNPSLWNYGNAVFTASDRVMKEFAPKSFDKDCVLFGTRKSHPFFKTTSSAYGSRPPCVHTMPHSFHPRNQSYWEHMARVGMYKDCGLNTSVDRSRVIDWDVE